MDLQESHLTLPTITVCLDDSELVNDRNTLKRDSAETEASARSTEASAEASAESLAKKYVKISKFLLKN